MFFKNRATNTRVRSGGIAVAVKRTHLAYITPIETDCNLLYWFKISNKLTNFGSETLCGVIYVPPENTRYAAVDPFTDIQSELESLRSDYNQILLLGDLNTRTGKLKDYIEPYHFLLQELGLDALENSFDTELECFEKANVSIERKVTDTNTNNFGYKLVDFCKSNSLYLLNGRIGRDRITGKNTCRGASCVDYFISNSELFQYARDLFIDDYCQLFSDVHNPVCFEMTYNMSYSTTPSIKSGKDQPTRVK